MKSFYRVKIKWVMTLLKRRRERKKRRKTGSAINSFTALSVRHALTKIVWKMSRREKSASQRQNVATYCATPRISMVTRQGHGPYGRGNTHDLSWTCFRSCIKLKARDQRASLFQPRKVVWNLFFLERKLCSNFMVLPRPPPYLPCRWPTTLIMHC
jgi:hypothetical protein